MSFLFLPVISVRQEVPHHFCRSDPIYPALPFSGLSPDHFADLESDDAHHGSHCQGHAHPYAGILDVLSQLRQAGYRTAIVSNKGQAAVSSLHDEFFKDLVDFSMGESPAYKKKPAPDMVWEALKRLGCAKEDAAYVGDSEVDKLTADHAGLTSVLVSWGFRDKPFLESLHPDYLVDSRQELADLFCHAH